MKTLTIKDIILEKIAATGADGLCNTNCECSKHWLFACARYDTACKLAKKVFCKDHCDPNACETCEKGCRGYDKACKTGRTIYVPLETEEGME